MRRRWRAVMAALVLVAAVQSIGGGAGAARAQTPEMPIPDRYTKIWNDAPVVSSGPTATVEIGETLQLNGSATDDGVGFPPGHLATWWYRYKGPATVEFGDQSKLSTTARFGAAGQYLLVLYATDGDRETRDYVVINVTEVGQSHRFRRIMPLGDSITRGYRGSSNSYRAGVSTALTDRACLVDIVGSDNNPYTVQPPYTAFDRSHEGHAGWRADELGAKITGFAAKHRPDIVLLHAGTNDIYQGQSVASTVAELDWTIDQLRQHNPSITVLLAKVIPAVWDATAGKLPALNAEIDRYVAADDYTGGPKVIAVDQYTGFDPLTMTGDGTHPNTQGEEAMAARWRDALLPLVASSCDSP